MSEAQTDTPLTSSSASPVTAEAIQALLKAHDEWTWEKWNRGQAHGFHDIAATMADALRQLLSLHETREAAIRQMTKGDEATVQAIIHVAAKFVDDPDAAILLRHVAAQGQRLQQSSTREAEAFKAIHEADLYLTEMARCLHCDACRSNALIWMGDYRTARKRAAAYRRQSTGEKE